MAELLKRYSDSQIKIISAYWDMIASETRTRGRVCENVKLRSMKYWSKFPAEVVLEALKRHLNGKRTAGEKYTEGIMRFVYKEFCGGNVYLDNAGAGSPKNISLSVSRNYVKPKKSRFCNFEGREIDYNELRRLEDEYIDSLVDKYDKENEEELPWGKNKESLK